MARRQTRRHRSCQARESAQGGQGLLRPAQEHHPHRQAGGEKANQYAFRDRKRRKRAFRALSIQRLNTAVRPFRPQLQPLHCRLEQGQRPRRSIARYCRISRSPSRRRSRRLLAKPSPRWRKRSTVMAGIAPPSTSIGTATVIDRAYVQRMAGYNRWQNKNLSATDELSDDERRQERGAFFGSIHKTLSHIWGDRSWMSHLMYRSRPASPNRFRCIPIGTT